MSLGDLSKPIHPHVMMSTKGPRSEVHAQIVGVPFLGGFEGKQDKRSRFWGFPHSFTIENTYVDPACLDPRLGLHHKTYVDKPMLNPWPSQTSEFPDKNESQFNGLAPLDCPLTAHVKAKVNWRDGAKGGIDMWRKSVPLPDPKGPASVEARPRLGQPAICCNMLTMKSVPGKTYGRFFPRFRPFRGDTDARNPFRTTQETQ